MTDKSLNQIALFITFSSDSSVSYVLREVFTWWTISFCPRQTFSVGHKVMFSDTSFSNLSM